MKGGTAIFITIFGYRRWILSWQEVEELQNDKPLSGGACKRLRDLIEDKVKFLQVYKIRSCSLSTLRQH